MPAVTALSVGRAFNRAATIARAREFELPLLVDGWYSYRLPHPNAEVWFCADCGVQDGKEHLPYPDCRLVYGRKAG
jgi:hypothetical protein